MPSEQEINDFIEKVKASKEKTLDLSSDEDMSIAIMNLVSIEEHFFFTGAKTGKSEYYQLLNQARKIRGELLRKIVKEPEGEVWCISKHLLAATMRLIEVGAKQLNRNNKEEANDLFSKAYQLYSLFWGLNLKIIKPSEISGTSENGKEPEKEIKKIEDNQLNNQDKQGTDFLGKLGDMVKKLIDCCKE